MTRGRRTCFHLKRRLDKQGAFDVVMASINVGCPSTALVSASTACMHFSEGGVWIFGPFFGDEVTLEEAFGDNMEEWSECEEMICSFLGLSKGHFFGQAVHARCYPHTPYQ